MTVSDGTCGTEDTGDTGDSGGYASLFERTAQNFTGEDARRIREVFPEPPGTAPPPSDQP